MADFLESGPSKLASQEMLRKLENISLVDQLDEIISISSIAKFPEVDFGFEAGKIRGDCYKCYNVW